MACKKTRANSSTLASFFAERKMCVDFLHFKCVAKCELQIAHCILYFGGHKKSDKYCQQETNPNNYPELRPVNSVVCEQTFSFTNHYSNLKSMNGPRYNFFWIYILDLHNHYVEDPRVLKVNPLSPYRMQSIFENAFEKMSFK